VAASPRDVLVDWFEVEHVVAELPPSYNVAPTDDVPAVTADQGRRALGVMSWGLGGRINARAETLTQQPRFRQPFLTRRCLLPADGFYEWETLPGGAKQPFLFAATDGHPLALAGIWDAPGACAIVTSAASEPVVRLHDRMPVVVDPERWDDWLDPDADVDELRSLLVPPREVPLTVQRVGTRVNDVRNNDARLLDPVPPPPEPLRLL